MSTILPYVLLIIVIVLASFDRQHSTTDKERTKYTYAKKPMVMTEHEQKFYNILSDAVGDQYYILAQAHLSSFLKPAESGRRYKPAFRHINGKSIDFLLCDHNTLAPVLGIELDDKTHERSDRRLRDVEVERIFKDANLPLLTIPSHGEATIDELRDRVLAVLA